MAKGSRPAPAGSTSPRYLALAFPLLPIERLRATRPHLFVGRHDAPIASVETVGKTVRLAAFDAEAARLGLTVGMTLADARALVPGLDTFDHDPHADLLWLESLADGCARYGPDVVLDPPDGLVLDIAGCIHAWEGERFLAADVERRLARRGVAVRHAFGDTPDVARALARFAGAPAPDEARAVKRLPVAALELDGDATVALTEAGLRTVGDVMTLPLGTLAARFGEDAAAAVRRLNGDGKVPVRPVRPHPVRRETPITAERRLAEPVARPDEALEVLADLAAEAVAELERRGQGGRCWRARLFRSDGQVQTLRVETGQPTRDVPALLRLLRERVDGLAGPLDPGSGVDLVRLDVVLADRLDAAQLKLEGGDDAQLAGPVAPPATRPGRTRIRRSVSHGHLPEQGELMLPDSDSQPAAFATQAKGEPPLRPIHLFDPPQPIEADMADLPDGPPHRFRWRRTLHDIARVEGPERITGEGWRRHDANTPTRDYFRVEDRRGRRFWIFRHGLPAGTEAPRWYVHGLFA